MNSYACGTPRKYARNASRGRYREGGKRHEEVKSAVKARAEQREHRKRQIVELCDLGRKPEDVAFLVGGSREVIMNTYRRLKGTKMNNKQPQSKEVVEAQQAQYRASKRRLLEVLATHEQFLKAEGFWAESYPDIIDKFCSAMKTRRFMENVTISRAGKKWKAEHSSGISITADKKEDALDKLRELLDPEYKLRIALKHLGDIREAARLEQSKPTAPKKSLDEVTSEYDAYFLKNKPVGTDL